MSWGWRAFRRVALAVVVGTLAYLEFLVVSVKLPIIYVLGLAAIPAAGAGWLFYREGPKSAPISCESVLRAMLTSLYQEDSGRYRANIMYPDRKRRKLTVHYAYNMDGYVDRHLQLPVGKGCAGQCFSSGNITTFDFTKMEHSAYGVDTKKTPVWADLRSIVSYPIKREDGKVVAVLSIDSSETIDATGFRDSGTHKALGLYADLVLTLMDAE